MATSSDVTTGDQATAAQYNNLRTDALENNEYVGIAPSVHWAAGATAFEDWDISAIIPANAQAAEIMINTDGAGGNNGCRKNGTAINRYIGLPVSTLTTMFCDVDANRVIEIYTSHTSNGFIVIGYILRQ